ncbi:MAG: UDP-N-acetylmuramoyl-L-alanyl-D-glutamate--2,6-diaminopimelate ligase [Actinomycetota bacterium]|nr:UDP-N-acetylmuramoyl-L-alanyl-D-glutamate--2,6-diaminopimelate ligase [Actinomycetota bacterium]
MHPTLTQVIGGRTGLKVTGLAYDSRSVGPGSVFFAVPGFRHDGHDFAAEAVQRGAVALVVERPLGLGVPEVVVPSVRVAMAEGAAQFHGDPSASLDVVGVTGTDGKSTTASLLRSIFEAAGRPCGLVSSLGIVVAGVEYPTRLTTPEAIDLQGHLRTMVDGGDASCVVEASSQGLQLGRCDKLHWAGAIFTGLTRDHQDFHGDMESYFLAKRRLFEAGPGVAVINIDDPFGRRLANEVEAPVTVALDQDADYRAEVVEDRGLAGLRMRVRAPDGELTVSLRLPGRYNARNALAALAMGRGLGVDGAALAAGLAEAQPPRGRMEQVDTDLGFVALVDYAHTPDGLSQALRLVRDVAGSGRVICVFGCDGDRDRGKRPLMARAVSALADVTIVTSNNPRSEDPEAIVAQALAGAKPPAEGIVDRQKAIARAIDLAAPGDVVLIAGKGHELQQQIGERRLDFSDVAVAREALAERSSRSRPAA